jgi:hypothetical protein
MPEIPLKSFCVGNLRQSLKKKVTYRSALQTKAHPLDDLSI